MTRREDRMQKMNN